MQRTRMRMRYYGLRSIIAVGAVIVPALVSLNVIGAAKAAILWVIFAVSLVVGLSAALEASSAPGNAGAITGSASRS